MLEGLKLVFIAFDISQILSFGKQQSFVLQDSEFYSKNS